MRAVKLLWPGILFSWLSVDERGYSTVSDPVALLRHSQFTVQNYFAYRIYMKISFQNLTDPL